MRCPNCQTDIADSTIFCPECGLRLSAEQVPTPAADQPVLQQRYVITQKLGQGGMGAVYRAADRRLSTVNWAVKELSDAALTNSSERDQARETFRHEAELLARLAHPNLPRVTDHFEEGGKHYLVMEFVPGETMLAFVARTGLPQPPERVFAWARQLCEVLEYLHSQDPPVIFRDLKPANIMITPNGTLKLIDFGIARLFKPGQAKDTQAFGTIGYSAPEQYGRGQTDARSDVYSLGVLLHQLLSGYDPTATPFRLPPANQVNPQISQPLAAVLARATDHEPERRFGSLRELREALLAAGAPAAGPTVPAPPLGLQQVASAPPAGAYVSQPIAAGLAPGSTGLALTSRWTGIAGLALTALALVCNALARGSELGQQSAWYDVGVFAGLFGFAVLALAIILGVVALLTKATAATQQGRRDAIIGIVCGSVALLTCCMALAVSPNSNDESGGAGRAPAVAVAQPNQL